MRMTGLLRWILPLGVLAVGTAIAPLQASEGRASQSIPTLDSPPVETLDAEARAHAAMALDPPDWTAARAAFLEAAETGSATAMSYLGWIYEEGRGVPADQATALNWYERAAMAGAQEFAVKAGWMHLGGQGVAASRDQAETWFTRAIDAGHAPGNIALASLLIADAQGGRNPERIPEARKLLEQALAEGYPTAAFFLARLYIEGVGGHPTDDTKAAHYTEIGAEDGNAQMQAWLAFMYLQGRGVAQDPLTAMKWANLAAAGGDSMGEQLRQLLESELTPEQVREGRQLAVDWAVPRR